MLVVGQRGGAGDKDLHACRWRHLRHRVAHGLDRFAGQRLTLIAGQIELDVGGLTVGALRPGRSQRVTPEVLNVLDVGGVCPKFGDETVVEFVCVCAQGGVALQHDHR